MQVAVHVGMWPGPVDDDEYLKTQPRLAASSFIDPTVIVFPVPFGVVDAVPSV